MKHAKQILAGEKRETQDGYDLVCACEENCEGNFSWSSCDLCDSNLGGDRHRAALIKPGTKEEPIYLDVCSCCIEYIANGDLCDCD